MTVLLDCRLVPDAVVRGLQLSLGLSLATKGIKNVWFKVAEVRLSIARLVLIACLVSLS